MFDGCREIFRKIDEVCQNKIFYQKLRENDSLIFAESKLISREFLFFFFHN